MFRTKSSPNVKNRLVLWGLVLAWAFLGVLVFRLVWGQTGWIANRELTKRLVEMEKDIENIRAENEALRREILYRRSEEWLEELARTELRRLRADEQMVVFPTPPSGEHDSAKK